MQFFYVYANVYTFLGAFRSIEGAKNEAKRKEHDEYVVKDSAGKIVYTASKA